MLLTSAVIQERLYIVELNELDDELVRLLVVEQLLADGVEHQATGQLGGLGGIHGGLYVAIMYLLQKVLALILCRHHLPEPPSTPS